MTDNAGKMSGRERDVLTSDVLNYLVMRYLQESGFGHTAFVFGHESSVTRTTVDPNHVPPGSLITFIQKGLQYLELEANIEGQVRCCTPHGCMVLHAAYMLPSGWGGGRVQDAGR